MDKKPLTRSQLIDVNVCSEKIGNRFNLVLIAALRARELSVAHKKANRKDQLNSPVTALLEIQDGKIGKEYLRKYRNGRNNT